MITVDTPSHRSLNVDINHQRHRLAMSELDFLAVFLNDSGVNVQEHAQSNEATVIIENLLTQRGVSHFSSLDILKQIKNEFSIVSFPKALSQASSTTYPLHLAVRAGNLTEVRRLVGIGYKINQTDLFGSTPLHVAAMYGHKEIAEYLIARGASIDASTYEYDMYDIYYTPLDLAIKYAPNTEIVALLIQKGASPSNWNQALYTIVDIAFDAIEDNDYPAFDLVLSKLEAITKYEPDGLWCWIDGEAMPIAAILQTYASKMDDPIFHERLMQSVENINAADKLDLMENYMAAKNLFHAFPSDEEYTFKINNYPAEMSAQGYHSVFTTALAHRSLHAYQQTLIGKLDQVGFKNMQAMYPRSNEPLLKNVEYFSKVKQNVFLHVEQIYQLGMDAKLHAHLYEKSEELFRLYETGQTILLPCGWDGHAIDVILNKDLNLFIVANAGESYPGIDSGINAYNHQFAIGVDDIYHILTNHEKMEMEFKRFYDLGLTHNDEYSLILPEQEFGNCAWYSQQLSERALIFIELKNEVSNSMLAATLTDTWFNELDQFHQTMVLKEYLDQPFLETAALGDILIHYHSKLTTPAEIERAKLILDNLTSPDNKSFFIKFYNLHRYDISSELKQFMKANGYKLDGMREADFSHEQSATVIDIDDVIKMDDNDVLSSSQTVLLNASSNNALHALSLQVAPLFHEDHPVIIQLI